MAWCRTRLAVAVCSLIPCASVAQSPPKGRSAVVAVGHCDTASSAITARALRALLQPRLGAVLLTEAETALPLGGLSERPLPEVEHGVAAARREFYADKVGTAVAALEALLEDVRRLPPSDARWTVERDLRTLLAQAQAKTDAPGAVATLRSIFRVEPGYHPDTALYPPTFRTFAEGVRKREEDVPTNRLDVAVSPPGTPVYVDGRRLGAAPLTLRLPPGTYRIEADFGHRGLVQGIQLPPPPELASPVELAAAVEGAVLVDAGPCVEPGPNQKAALARLTVRVGVDRLYAIRWQASGDGQWVVLDEVDAAGEVLRAARAQVKPGAPETEALGAVADYLVTGHSAAVVELVKRAEPAAPTSARQKQATGTRTPACTASGRVVHGNGQAATGTIVRARNLAASTWQTVETGPKGRFAFRDLARGDYELSIEGGPRKFLRRFSVATTCPVELGTLRLRDTSAAPGQPADGGKGEGG